MCAVLVQNTTVDPNSVREMTSHFICNSEQNLRDRLGLDKASPSRLGLRHYFCLLSGDVNFLVDVHELIVEALPRHCREWLCAL